MLKIFFLNFLLNSKKKKKEKANINAIQELKPLEGKNLRKRHQYSLYTEIKCQPLPPHRLTI